MNFIETSRFKRAYESLPPETKESVKVSLECRLTFQISKHCVILRNVGHHDLTLKRP